MEEEKAGCPVTGERKEDSTQAGAGTHGELRNLVKNMPDNLFLQVVFGEGYGKKKPV